MNDGDPVGRDAELEMIDRLLDALPSGRGGAVVFGGEPGIGKSRLLGHARAGATGRGLTVLSVLATESAVRLPFTGLHQVLQPVLGHADRLTPALRTSLQVALGLAGGDEPGVFRVALAALHLVAEAAADRPVLVLVDDLHWLDGPSRDVLGFLARRLADDPVALVAAHRSGHDPVPTVTLPHLDAESAERLLDRRWPGLDHGLRRRVLDEAAGNPLALVELPAVLPGPLDARAPGGPVALISRLERAYAGRWAELPAPAMALLLAAALNDGDPLAEAVDAAGRMVGRPVHPDDLAPATALGLARTDGARLEFGHPLARSAVAASATPAQRRSAHTALAQTLAGHPLRAVWHRAAVADGLDEDIAATLDEAAGRARAYGAAALSGRALERAAELTVDRSRRGDRLLRAAEIAFELGRAGPMLQLLDQVQELADPELEASRLLLVQEWFDEEDDWSDPGRARAFADTAARLRDAGRPELAVRSLSLIAARCFGHDYPLELRAAVAAAATRLAGPDRSPDVLFVLAGCGRNARWAEVHEGLTAAAGRPGVDVAALRTMATAATMVGDFRTATEVLLRAASRLRAQGGLGRLAQTLTSLAWAHILCGQLPEADAAADEAVRLCHETAQWWWKTSAITAQALLLGVQGSLARSRKLIAEAEAETPQRSASPLMWAEIQLAAGSTALAAGNPDRALDLLAPMFDPNHRAYGPSTRWWGVTELVEAAYRAGRLDEVRHCTRELAAEAAGTGSPVLVAAAAFVAPLVAPPDRAEAAFAAADAGENHHLRGRVELLFGEWLADRWRTAEAREHLRAAVAAFDRIGACRWADTARARLVTTGERPDRRPDVRAGVDATQLRIARLAAAGMTDREIAEELYLSVRAVAAQLARTEESGRSRVNLTT